jgi:hypothetical protein
MPMKTTISATLDYEIAEELNKQENKSEFINNLLKNAFFNKIDKEKTLDEKLKEVKDLQDSIIIEQQLKIEENEEKIKMSRDAINKIKEEQLKKIQEDVSLLELEPDLINELLTIYDKNNDVINKPMPLIDIVDKYRLKGYRIGTFQLITYIKYKRGIDSQLGSFNA